MRTRRTDWCARERMHPFHSQPSYRKIRAVNQGAGQAAIALGHGLVAQHGEVVGGGAIQRHPARSEARLLRDGLGQRLHLPEGGGGGNGIGRAWRPFGLALYAHLARRQDIVRRGHLFGFAGREEKRRRRKSGENGVSRSSKGGMDG